MMLTPIPFYVDIVCDRERITKDESKNTIRKVQWYLMVLQYRTEHEIAWKIQIYSVFLGSILVKQLVSQRNGSSLMNTIMEITSQKCTGCHACFSICPKKAIEMKPDERGFLHPVINRELCVECKLCQKACPLNEEKARCSGDPAAYAAYSLDRRNQWNSSSGGIFSLLATEILHQGGAVYGAAFSDDFLVEHRRATENIRPLQTSKYVQSRIGDTFFQVELDIRDGKDVLFSGTPCQVEGLYSYLHQRNVDLEKLLTVDLICHGVPSPLLWEKHLETISKGRIPVFANFRDKRLSWGGFSLTCQFDDGSEYSVAAGKDAYMQGFFANMTLRESCYNCKFKTKSRVSDITLADYWRVEKHDPDMHNKNGTSAVIIHSQKGQDYFDLVASKVNRKKIPLSSIIPGNLSMIQSAAPHPRKELFWKRAIEQYYDRFEDIIAEMLVPTTTERIKLWVVRIKRLGKRVLKK